MIQKTTLSWGGGGGGRRGMWWFASERAWKGNFAIDFVHVGIKCGGLLVYQ